MAYERRFLRNIRYAVQSWFLLSAIFAGYQFYRFVLHFERAGSPFTDRPSSIDGFLPIAGLISLKRFILTGSVEPLHPAAFVIFTSAVVVSLLLKKGFCGWICPVGTVSQWFWMAGEKVFGKGRRLPAYADLPLRAVKYLLMGLFLFFILIGMSPVSIDAFFSSDYFKIADIRTMKFFTEMSEATGISLAILGGLSLIYKNFWCRYLCPYGALLGLLSFLSPVKIRRREEICVHCHSCSRNCPSMIDVERKDVVRSPECFGCLTCVSECPAEGALDVTAWAGSRRVIKAVLLPVLILSAFYLVIGTGMFLGKWHSQIPYEEYRRILSSDYRSLSHPER